MSNLVIWKAVKIFVGLLTYHILFLIPNCKTLLYFFAVKQNALFGPIGIAKAFFQVSLTPGKITDVFLPNTNIEFHSQTTTKNAALTLLFPTARAHQNRTLINSIGIY